MHSKVKSSFFLTLFAIVLSACGVTPSSSSSPASSSNPSSSTPSSSVSSSSSVENVTITFDAKGGSAVTPVTVAKNASVVAPTAPTRAGYRFGGWFRGKAGLTWLEPEATTFPRVATSNETFFAYWEPLNSKTINYSNAETYFSSLGADVGARLNPMTYQYAHENAIMGSLSTPMFATEVDWDRAIELGIADFVGDFSKIKARQFSIDSLDFAWILIGAQNFPTDNEGRDFLVNGKYDRTVAARTLRDEWTFKLRNDIFFENGTQVTSSTFKYSLSQYLDPLQNNRRSTLYFDRGTGNDSGLPILNAEKFRFQDPTAGPLKTMDELEVGFTIIDDLTFKVKFWREIPQSEAVGFGNMTLVHPTIFASSLTQGVNSTYGTPANPFVSYGGYLIKSWSDNQRIVLNKNFDYVRRDLITYKSVVYEYTSSPEQNIQLFKSGLLSATGLLGDNFLEFAENPGVKFTWAGYPQYIIFNFAPSRTSGQGAYLKSSITSDARFRQAIFFALNRELYNSTIYLPNVPSVMPVPNDTKVYLEDALFYSESPNHLQNLADFGITEGSFGFLPDRARSLFNQVLADNPGISLPITLKMPAIDSTLDRSLVGFMKNEIEKVFNLPGQPQRLIIETDFMSSESYDTVTANWDFDLTLINLGFGSSTMIQMQYASIGFLVAALFGPDFGVNLPFGTGPNGQQIDLRNDPTSFYNQRVSINLSPTLDYLEGLLEDDPDYFTTRPAFKTLFDALVANPETGKARGIYNETLLTLALYLRVQRNSNPYAGTRSEPFPGATQEVWKIVAAMEKVFFQQMPLIPTSTLQDAVIYAPNVQILWPSYSVTFGWGATRYRYLSSDADFADGMFNSFEAAFVASQTN